MSTVIHNGYILDRGMPIADMARQLDSWFSDSRYEAVISAVAKIVTILEDATTRELGLEIISDMTNETLKMDNYKFIKDDVELAKRILFDFQYAQRGAFVVRRSPSLDISMTIRFYSDPDDPEQHFCTVQTEREQYISVWEKIDGVEEFKYWNNTDHPETITYKEWKARSLKWDKVLGGNTFAINSLSWELSMLPLLNIDIDKNMLLVAMTEARIEAESARKFAERFLMNSSWGSDDEDDDDGDETGRLVKI